MNHRRREGLGRNRRSPGGPRTTRYFLLAATVMVAAALLAYDYFTTPERVFGSRELDCPAHQIEWQDDPDGLTTIKGCGRTVHVTCTEEACAFEP